jgi:hypothetical protein
MTKNTKASTAIEVRELSADEIDQVSGGLTNGDDPFVKAVMDAYYYTIATGSGVTFPAGTTTGSGGGGGKCSTNHNGVQY